jgi:hypothetical protein
MSDVSFFAETNCFHELEHYFPHSEIKLCMVGPEMRVPKCKVSSGHQGSTKKTKKATACEWRKEENYPRFSWCLSQCTTKEFLKVPSSSSLDIASFSVGLGKVL